MFYLQNEAYIKKSSSCIVIQEELFFFLSTLNETLLILGYLTHSAASHALLFFSPSRGFPLQYIHRSNCFLISFEGAFCCISLKSVDFWKEAIPRLKQKSAHASKRPYVLVISSDADRNISIGFKSSISQCSA